jgi:fructose transport system substrate-binding protein
LGSRLFRFGHGLAGHRRDALGLLMASLGIEAIKKYADDGTIPEPTPGLDFFNTGVNLVTANPVDGVPSISVEEGLERCWG